MSDLRTARRSLEAEVAAPDFAALVGISRRRQQRRRAAVVTGLAAVVVAALLVGPGLGERRRTSPPEPARTPVLVNPSGWEVDDVLGHPEAFNEGTTTYDGLGGGEDATVWQRCTLPGSSVPVDLTRDCEHVAVDHPELVIIRVLSMQGRGGTHRVLLSNALQDAPGVRLGKPDIVVVADLDFWVCAPRPDGSAGIDLAITASGTFPLRRDLPKDPPQGLPVVTCNGLRASVDLAAKSYAPLPAPSSGSTAAASGTLAADAIVDHPDATLEATASSSTDSRVRAEVWVRCTVGAVGDEACTRSRLRWAVRVSGPGSSHSFTARFYRPELTSLGGDRFWVCASLLGGDLVATPRDHLLMRLAAPVEPAAGPDVVSCRGRLARVDARALVVTPLALESQSETMWATTANTVIWGRVEGGGDSGPYVARWIGRDGRRHEHTLATRGPRTIVIADGGSSGEMAFFDAPEGWGPDWPPDVRLHISTDLGATWQVRLVPAAARIHYEAGRLAADWATWPSAR